MKSIFLRNLSLLMLFCSISWYCSAQETPFIIYGPINSQGMTYTHYEGIEVAFVNDYNRCFVNLTQHIETIDYYDVGNFFLYLDNNAMNYATPEFYQVEDNYIAIDNGIAFIYCRIPYQVYLEVYGNTPDPVCSDTLIIAGGYSPIISNSYTSQIDNQHFLITTEEPNQHLYRLYYLNSNAQAEWSLDIPPEMIPPSEYLNNTKLIDNNQIAFISGLNETTRRLVILNRSGSYNSYIIPTSDSNMLTIFKNHVQGKLLMAYKQNNNINIDKYENGYFNTILSYPDTLGGYVSGTADSSGYLIVQSSDSPYRTYISKYSWENNLLWSRCFLNTTSYENVDVSPTGNYYIGGSYYANNQNRYVLMKILSNGDVPVANEESVLPIPDISSVAYPNPFSDLVNIRFNMKANTSVTAEIYNIKGQRLKSYDEKSFQRGENTITWDGTDERNKKVSNGVYYCKLNTPNKCFIQKVVLVR